MISLELLEKQLLEPNIHTNVGNLCREHSARTQRDNNMFLWMNIHNLSIVMFFSKMQ